MRKIIYSKECDEAAEKLGGYERIDCSLFPVWDALMRAPEGFDFIDLGDYSCRFARTIPIGDVPALIWIFTIGRNGDIVFEHVEIAS